MDGFTLEQVLALAPDPSSAKAGQGLGSPAKWSLLQRDASAVWGEIQGSGKDPYRTQVDLAGPAFHCTCPSRKFPCKHGLGLLLVLAAHPARVVQAEQPPWVVEWLAKRAATAERKATIATERATPSDDPQLHARREAERSKRATQRDERVRDGLDELRLWLADTVRNGLVAARQGGARSWDQMAARLVDAQAPGAARLVRELASFAARADDWETRVLERLALLWLLTESARRLDSLPAELAADVRQSIGWSTSDAELAALPGVRDRWCVAAQRIEDEDRLRVRRTWLFGRETGRCALLLSFSAGAQPFDAAPAPGSSVEAELVFHPSAWPLRASLRSSANAQALTDFTPHASASFEAALQHAAIAFAAQPWLERVPWCIEGCIPVRDGARWLACDAQGHALELHPSTPAWTFAAVSGGHPVCVAGEWDGERLRALACTSEGRWIPLEGASS